MTNQEVADFINKLNGDDLKIIQDDKRTHYKKHRHNFVTYIDEYLTSHGIQRSYIFREANIARGYGYKLLDGTKHTTNRDVIIRICIAARMNLDETQEALRCYDLRLLDREIYRDKIIIAGISSNKKLYDIDIWLCKAGEISLFDNYT